MGLFDELLGTAIRVVATPITIIEDIGSVVDGQKPKATKDNVKKILKGVSQAVDDLSEGKIIE